jgi:exportin-5
MESNGAMPHINGMAQQHPTSATPDLEVILQAIEAIYNPRSTNETRYAANQLLEDSKSSPQARELGYSLALDTTKDATLRHYGLTLLDYHIRFVWDGYDEDMEAILRNNVVNLAQNVRSEDPTYLRMKVAHEWTVFAKRSWATYWMNMDEQLVELFQASEAHREVVLYVLQTLAEDIFTRDDSLAATRGEVLATACIEVFTPEALMLDDGVPKTGHVINVRFGSEGWLQRLSTFLEWSLSNNHAAAVKTLNTLGSALSWMPSATIAATAGIQPICQGVLVGDASVRLVSPSLPWSSEMNRIVSKDYIQCRMLGPRS